MMQALNVVHGEKSSGIEIIDALLPNVGTGEVRVRTLAVALNYRDFALIHGQSVGASTSRYIPFSDACGVIDAVGDGVTRWSVGDRVCSLFFPDWLAGEPRPDTHWALGASEKGVGQTYFVANEHGLIAAPEHLSALEAATLPCAALTAWNAVMGSGEAKPGRTVLLQGTGGVSLFALQFAKAAGAHVIMTSSSDEKLGRARQMGADDTINYRERPEWAEAAREITGGAGVDLVVEVGGAGTFKQSLQAIRLGGSVSVVGMLTGAVEELDIRNIYGRNAQVRGLTVGSRAMFEDMNRALCDHDIHPIVAETYRWQEAKKAFDALKAASHFGKIVLDFEA